MDTKRRIFDIGCRHGIGDCGQQAASSDEAAGITGTRASPLRSFANVEARLDTEGELSVSTGPYEHVSQQAITQRLELLRSHRVCHTACRFERSSSSTGRLDR